MAAKKRQCSNCRHYQDAGVSKNGWCTHPDRQTTEGAMLLVRGGELACRNPWGNDLFERREGEDRSRDAAPPTPTPDSSPQVTDDRVTSVITPPTRGGDAGGEDRVVSDRPAPRRDRDDLNDAALQEQEERAHIMSRGSGPAIARARQRHLDRRRTERPDEPADEEDTRASAHTDSPRPKAALHASAPRDAVITQRDRMDRRVSASGTNDLIGIDQPVPRSEVRQRLPEPANDPRFTSVPAIDPDFDLQLTGHRDETTSGDEVTPAPPPVASDLEYGPEIEPAPTSYEHVLNRARRVREAKHHGRASRPRPAAASHREPTPLPTHEHRRFAEPLLRAEMSVPTADEPVDPWRAFDPPVETGVDDPEPIEDNRFQPDIELDEFRPDEGQDEVIGADTLPPLIEDAPVRRRRNWFGGLGRRRDDRGTRNHEAQGEEDVWHSAQRWAEPVHDPAPIAEALPDDQWFEDDQENRTLHAQTAPDDDGWDGDNQEWESPDEQVSPAARRNEGRDQNTAIDDSSDHVPGGNHTQDLRPETGQSALPDLDALLAHATASPRRDGADPTAAGIARTTLRHVPSPAPVPVAESRPNRWTSPSPSTSALRASNFRDWPGGRPILAADDDRDGDASAVLVHAISQPLPDLDADHFDLREVVERGGELLDMDIAIAQEVPRACRTCRSFHSADGGARGWCTNDWAFTHRRMVNEDDLACDSTIGCWWLPADRFWMLEEPVASAASTPLMDAFMARFATRPDRKVSTS